MEVFMHVRFSNHRLMRWLLTLCIATTALIFVSQPTVRTEAACTIHNALVVPGADPSIWYRSGNYYLVQSDGANHIYLRASTTLGGLGAATNHLIYTAPVGTDHSTQIWGPEIEYLAGNWYIYFAADSGNNNNLHRMFAIRANTQDPLGAWSFMNKVSDPTNEWAIDGTVFFYNNSYYMLWSGTPPGVGGGAPQQIYIAHMSDPLHIDEAYRKLIANPDQAWETSVQAIEEGPEAFIGPNNKLTIVYSANASWTKSYNLGELIYNGGDIGYYGSYSKVGPVFSSANGVYGPGHLSLPVPHMNGSLYTGLWMVYHAKTTSADGWNDRDIFAQPHSWNADGTPNFGSPQATRTTTKIPQRRAKRLPGK